MDEIQQIKDASEAGYSSKSGSIVDKLIEAQWCSENDLVHTLEKIDSINAPSAASFFQLPFPIKLPSKWITLKIDTIPDPLISFKIIGTELNSFTNDKEQKFSVDSRNSFSGKDKYFNGFSDEDLSGNIVKTQIIIIFKLWRYWNEVFPAYKNALTGNANIKELLSFRGGYAKDNGIPVTAGSFEFDLAKRLRTESLYIIKKILPAYSVACREQIPKSPNYLFNFFAMVEGGRILTLGPGRSMLSDIIKPFSKTNLKNNESQFKQFIEKEREVSVYEQYLMNTFRQIESGETGLAIVYTVMILEWFANEMIESHFLSQLEKKLGKNSALQQLAEERLWKSKKSKYIRISVKDRFTKYFVITNELQPISRAAVALEEFAWPRMPNGRPWYATQTFG